MKAVFDYIKSLFGYREYKVWHLTPLTREAKKAMNRKHKVN